MLFLKVIAKKNHDFAAYLQSYNKIMPANLNALIRYKTINSCLHGGRRRWTIDELRVRCSDALSEDRGMYAGVSERTLRDDLRVMRSNILGFNAPIKQEGGLYFYSDPTYSILSLSVTDAGLAEQILGLLLKIRPKVNHPELEIILQRLCGLLGREYEPLEVKRMEGTLEEAEPIIVTHRLHHIILNESITDPDLMNYNYLLKEEDVRFNQPEPLKSTGTASKGRPRVVMWGQILGLLSHNRHSCICLKN